MMGLHKIHKGHKHRLVKDSHQEFAVEAKIKTRNQKRTKIKKIRTKRIKKRIS